MQVQLEKPYDSQLPKHEFNRADVIISADIRVGGHKNKVEVVDMSQTGFRMECMAYIADGKVIYLTIPTFHQMQAHVIWQTEWLYGCQFAQPLHVAVFEHITSVYPALAVTANRQPEALIYGAAAGLEWRKNNVFAC